MGLSPHRHSGAGRNPGDEAGMFNGHQVFADAELHGLPDGHSRLRGNGLSQPLDSGLRRNDGRSRFQPVLE